MRWKGRRQSDRVEDRRGGRGGGGRGVRLGGGAILVVIVVSFLTGQNPLEILSLLESGGATRVDVGAPGPGSAAPPADDEASRFVSTVLADTEDTWTALFADRGRSYRLPTLVLFEGSTPSACGLGSSAMGPFYCPADAKVYLDLSFFRELGRRFGAPGDFAQAYVVAHEVGHHVQNLLGISGEIQRMRSRVDEARANELSVRLELQADCLAGVWGARAAGRGLLEPGDVEEGLRAAAAIGDDTLQRRAGGAVAPESWTHGSSEQRVRWFRHGLDTGDPDACDTFETSRL